MKIVIPFYVLFNTNNWLYHTESHTFSYSDDIVSLNSVYLQIPLKDDSEYNEKINMLIKNFITTLYNGISMNNRDKSDLTISTNIFTLLENKTEPFIVHLKSGYSTHKTMYFDFSPN